MSPNYINEIILYWLNLFYLILFSLINLNLLKILFWYYTLQSKVFSINRTTFNDASHNACMYHCFLEFYRTARRVNIYWNTLFLKQCCVISRSNSQQALKILHVKSDIYIAKKSKTRFILLISNCLKFMIIYKNLSFFERFCTVQDFSNLR